MVKDINFKIIDINSIYINGYINGYTLILEKEISKSVKVIYAISFYENYYIQSKNYY